MKRQSFWICLFLLLGYHVHAQSNKSNPSAWEHSMETAPTKAQLGVRFAGTLSHRQKLDTEEDIHFLTGGYSSLLLTLKSQYHQVYLGPQLLYIPNAQTNFDSRNSRFTYLGVHAGYRYYMGYATFPLEFYFQLDVRFTRVEYDRFARSNATASYLFYRDVLEGAFGLGWERKIAKQLDLSGGFGLGFRTRGEGLILNGNLALTYSFRNPDKL